MKKLVLSILFLASIIIGKSQPTIWIENMTTGPGQISIPIYTTGFDSIQDATFTLIYSPNLTFVSTQNLNPNFSESVVVSNATPDNRYNFSAFKVGGCITTPDSSILIELVFDFSGGAASLTWDPGSIVTRCLPGVPTVFIPGYINTMVGINERGTWNLQCYPNPAQDFLNISGCCEQPGWYTILTAEGWSIMKGHFTPTHNTRIDVSHLPAGMYLLRMEDVAGNIVSRKLVVQR